MSVAGRSSADDARNRLQQRIETRYRLVTETVQVGALTFPFTRIANPDTVLDEVAAEEDRLEKVSGRRADGDYLHLPYWAELWDSAMGMAMWLESSAKGSAFRGQGSAGAHGAHASLNPEPRTLNALHVLDLGCGMGLSGTTAAALGAKVLFADLESPALLLAQLNSHSWAHHIRTRQLDWRTDRLKERFDLILGSDILYERKQWDHLEPFWRAHLAPTGSILLGEPGRPTGDVFPEWITQRGWSLKQFEQTVSTRPKPIRIFELKIIAADKRGSEVNSEPFDLTSYTDHT